MSKFIDYFFGGVAAIFRSASSKLMSNASGFSYLVGLLLLLRGVRFPFLIFFILLRLKVFGAFPRIQDFEQMSRDMTDLFQITTPCHLWGKRIRRSFHAVPSQSAAPILHPRAEDKKGLLPGRLIFGWLLPTNSRRGGLSRLADEKKPTPRYSQEFLRQYLAGLVC